MAKNKTNLDNAKRAADDEYYTKFHDIETELWKYVEHNPDAFRGKTILLPCDDPEWSNFTRFFASAFDTLGIAKVISTSYNPGGRGKVFTLTGDTDHDGRTGMEDLTWEYLDGDGDFRSPEVGALLAGADMVVTNPPFSLFREFLAWIVAADKRFIIIGNMNAITYKEVFPLIQRNRMWLGATGMGSRTYVRPDGTERTFGNTCWFADVDHGKRHEPLTLMSEADNLRYNKAMRGRDGYERYDNCDAIEVPATKAIPSDYGGTMGVPISFLDKYNPEQFEIVRFRHGDDGKDLALTRDGTRVTPYFRILVRHTAASLAGELAA